MKKKIGNNGNLVKNSKTLKIDFERLRSLTLVELERAVGGEVQSQKPGCGPTASQVC